MNRRFGVLVVAGALALGVAGCASPSTGDAEACEVFTAAAEDQANAGDLVLASSDPSPGTKAAYRQAVRAHTSALHDAAQLADSSELADAFSRAAELWDGGKDSDLGYFLIAQDLEDFCS